MIPRSPGAEHGAGIDVDDPQLDARLGVPQVLRRTSGGSSGRVIVTTPPSVPP